MNVSGNAGLGILSEATVSSLYRGNRWRLPPARLEALVNIHALLIETILNNSEDFYEWEVDGRKSTTYST